MKIGFFEGSFDPFTNCHLQIVREEYKQQQLDILVVCIISNPLKKRKRRFKKELMQKAIEETLRKEGINAEVITHNGCVPKIYSKKHDKNKPSIILIRGVRNKKDRVREKVLAIINRVLLGQKTKLFYHIGRYTTSSTEVFSMYKQGQDISSFVPEAVYEAIKQESKKD